MSEPAIIPPGRGPGVGSGGWLGAPTGTQRASRRPATFWPQARAGLRPQGLSPLQFSSLLTSSRPRSVPGGTEGMQPQLRLHGVNAEEADHSSCPSRWLGILGGLSRQEQLGCELQA